MTNQCGHGQLARQCEICELMAEIKETRKQIWLEAAEIADNNKFDGMDNGYNVACRDIAAAIRRKAEEL